MAIESNSLPGEAQINTEIFHKYFPDAKINAVDMTLLPPRVVEYFEGDNRLGIDPKDYKEGDFINLFIIQHNSGDTTYVARQIKVSPKTLIENNPYYPLKEDLTYLLEIDPEGKDIGEAHIRMG